MPVLSLACHLPHNTPHIPSRYNNEQTTKQTKAINNSYIYINISCKCDTNRAGHFTLDAYASRPVACFLLGFLSFLAWCLYSTLRRQDITGVTRSALTAVSLFKNGGACQHPGILWRNPWTSSWPSICKLSLHLQIIGVWTHNEHINRLSHGIVYSTTITSVKTFSKIRWRH